MRKLLIFLALFAGSVAAEVRPFTAGSLQTILAEKAGRPFILALWSVNCTHCPHELRTLGRLSQRYPHLEVVLVSTDSPDALPELAKMATEFGLGKQSQWVFADAQQERLRFEIDRRWYGELPRTYLYDPQHQRESRSGVIPQEFIERWVQDKVK